MHRPARLLAVAFVSLLAATFLPTSRASAAAPWIYRGLTLPRHDVASTSASATATTNAAPRRQTASA